ncbi:MAG TPA: YraN family protein [Candidatus Dojkabacteria bacterium]
MTSLDYGQIGEDIAVKLLKANGYEIITRNFKCKLGEIDIIALDSDTLIFVEVKARWSRKFGNPEEAVNFKKLNKIKKVGEYFQKINLNMPKKKRIDVVSLNFKKTKVISAKIIKVI